MCSGEFKVILLNQNEFFGGSMTSPSFQLWLALLLVFPILVYLVYLLFAIYVNFVFANFPFKSTHVILYICYNNYERC